MNCAIVLCMHEILQQILFFFGAGLCHQYPDRSFESGGLFFSVCARDTGIYLGLAITLVILLILYARVPQKPAALPPLWAVITAVILILPLAADGITSYLGLRESTNLLRYLSGYLCGAGLAVLASGGLFSLWSQNNQELSAVQSPRKLSTLLVASCAAGAAFYVLIPYGGALAPLFAFACQLAAIAFINILILGTTRLWRREIKRGRRAVLVVLTFVAALGELALLSLLASGLGYLFPWYVHP